MNVWEKADKLKIIAHTRGTAAPVVSDYLYDRGIKVLSGNNLYGLTDSEQRQFVTQARI